MKNTDRIKLQKRYFEKPFTQNFVWRTTNPYVAFKERGLLQHIAAAAQKLPTSGRIIEIGCGEGPNLALLRELGVSQPLIGIDLSTARVSYCIDAIENMLGVAASAAALPFRDHSFELVFFRDLLHHVGSDRLKVLHEAYRLLKPGGELFFFEANGRNPCFLLLALTTKAEHGLFQSNIKNISSLASEVGSHTLYMYEPSNFFRLLFHYSAGFPGLASKKFFVLLCDTLSWMARRLIPRAMWAYICVKIVKNSTSNSPEKKTEFQYGNNG